MINTHILPQEFEYFEPRTVEEAVEFLASHGEKSRVMAGGTDLLVQVKMGKAHPEFLINISRIPGLRYLIEEEGLRIGALTSFRELEKVRLIQEKYTALFEAAQSVSSAQIKTMGTVGGNLCNASPGGDSVPPLIVFGAKVKLLGKRHERIVSVDEFFKGPGETVLSPEELLVEVQVPRLTGQTGSCFLKMGRVSADLAKVSVAVAIIREDGICKDCKIALGSVAEKPLRTTEAEAVMIGKKFSETLVEKASHQVSEEIRPIDDVRSTASYRKEVSKVLVRNAINLAWKRAII